MEQLNVLDIDVAFDNITAPRRIVSETVDAWRHRRHG